MSGAACIRPAPRVASIKSVERVLRMAPPCRLARIVCVGVELIELTVEDRAAWRRWLEKNHRASPGVWLTLARKANPGPTTLTYDEALEESLCFGWIDGQRGAGDGTTARQRFTHRGPRSRWSARNVGIVERLHAEGRMEPEGEAEVARAQADGRWAGAYAGLAKSVVPADLAAALRANPAAQAMFEILTSQNRYAILYRVEAARRPETRAANIQKFVAMLARGETVHPQKRQITD
jgi:uncharacterized protein YdeI (YjbR/CyaY-like superfamily)